MNTTMPESAKAPPYLSAAVILKGASGAARRPHYKRALIKAAARRILAERGLPGLHMRELATRCQVAPQTLYNHLGGRDEIIGSAIDELLLLQIARASATAAVSGNNFILAFCDLAAELAGLDQDYVRAVVAILSDEPHRNSLAFQIEQRCIGAYREDLKSMQKSGALREWVDVDHLSATLGDIIRVSLTQWWVDGMSAEWLRHELTLKVGLPLLGAALHDQARRIELAVINSTRAHRLMG